MKGSILCLTARSSISEIKEGDPCEITNVSIENVTRSCGYTHDDGSAEGDVVHDELEGLDVGNSFLRGTDHNQPALGSEQRQVAAQRHLVVVGRTDDQIERPGVGRKVLVTARVGGNEVGSTKLHGVVLLSLRVGDGSDVGPQSLGEQEGKVTESTNTDDSDIDAGSGTVGDERVVDSNTST